MADRPPFNAGTRFSVRRLLGSGAFGVVYEALDLERQNLVALKTLKHVTPDGLYRLKREFRSLADLQHPNLVQLHELLYVDDSWFIVMELVEGQGFFHWVRPGLESDSMDATTTRALEAASTVRMDARHDAPAMDEDPADAPALDVARLRHALRQLCEGVAAIHRAGKLHRDLKPSNVLVTDDGRVVILDFGLIADALPVEGSISRDFAGTPSFMAPEQMSGQMSSPAGDWYSVGVMLFQALTGKRPFRGSLLEILAQKSSPGPNVSGVLATAQPANLAELCGALLKPEPRDRPPGNEILAIAGAQAGQPAVPRTLGPTEIVGREKELTRLRQCVDLLRAGRTVVVRLQGESGMGKSALARTFLQASARDRDVLVLQGRCYERESVPFKALDGVVDSLSHLLKRLPEAQAVSLLPRDPHAACRLFPVLERVEVIATAPRRDGPPLDPLQRRRAGLASLRELLGRIADRWRLILYVDDAQWGDADSATALTDVLRPPGQPDLLLLLTYRPHTDDSGFVGVFNRSTASFPSIDTVDLTVAELDEQAAVDLADRLLMEAASVSPAAIARESRGNPFLIAELARDLVAGRDGGATSLTTLVAHRVTRLSPAARRLLEIVAVGGRPVPLETARRAAGLTTVDSTLLQELGLLHLARAAEVVGSSTLALECYHDRIRECILDNMGPQTVVARHRELAEALEETGGSAEALALHLQAAGYPERAAEHAIRAGDLASEALAFNRAVELYQLALSLIDERDVGRTQSVLVRLGDALVNAGLGYEGARAYLKADALARGDEQLELRRRAVHQLFSTGHLDEAMVQVWDLLRAVRMRMPETRVATLAALAYYRTLVWIRGTTFRRRSEADVPRADLVRLDTCFSLAQGLGVVDTIRGAVFQTRHTLLALRTGEPSRVARALSMEAAYRSIKGAGAHEAVTAVLNRARRLAAELDDPLAKAYCLVAEGIAACEAAEWRRSLARLDEAKEALRPCAGVRWEQVTADAYAQFVLYVLGEWTELTRRAQVLAVEARECGDLYAETMLMFSFVADLIADDPGAAEVRTGHTLCRWPGAVFDVQHFWLNYALCETDLYRGRGTAAYDRATAIWPKLRESLLTHVHVLHLFAQFLIGRCAVAAAVEGRIGALSRARDAARRIERARGAWATGLSDIIRAGVAAVEGRTETVWARLETARIGLVVAEMHPWAGAVSYWQARQRGIDAVPSADRWFSNQGVRNPERLAAMFVPGIEASARKSSAGA